MADAKVGPVLTRKNGECTKPIHEDSSEQRDVWVHVVRRLQFLRCSGEPIGKQEQVAKAYARGLAFDWRALLAEAAESEKMEGDNSPAEQSSKKQPRAQNTNTHGAHPSRFTVPQIRARKGKERIVGLTAHSTPVASIIDPWVDLLLVGDSLGMVAHGLPTPVGVTLEMMIMHGRAVMRGSSRALVVVDLPFGSYERTPEQAHESAVRVMQETGC